MTFWQISGAVSNLIGVHACSGALGLSQSYDMKELSSTYVLMYVEAVHAQDVLDERNQIPRSEVGLPDDKIVYSCSNQLYKVNLLRPTFIFDYIVPPFRTVNSSGPSCASLHFAGY